MILQGLRPSSRAGYSPQSVLGCAEEEIVDTGLIAYWPATLDQFHPEGPPSTGIPPYQVAMESQTATFPPNWRKIPQKVYDHERRQWDFTPSEPIFFSVNGRPGLNIGDALRENFMGLEGRDDPVLRDVGSTISCQFLVRLS